MRIKELDALRGIAAIMVVFFHYTFNKPESQLGFKVGTTGVDLFFIISGFVIFMSLSNITRSIDFVINRVSRLYPTYWASVTFAFFVLLINSNFSGVGTQSLTYLKNMTMFQYYLKAHNLDEVYWTMIIEMLFYLGVLLLFQFKLLKHFKPIGMFLLITAFVMKFFFCNYRLVIISVGLIPLIEFIPLFLAGTLFYDIYKNKNNSFNNYIMILCCFICQNLMFKNSGKERYYVSQSEYSLMLFIYFSLFIAFVNNRLTFIVSRWTLFLGKISFALYLTHNLLSTGILLPYFIGSLKINFWLSCLITLIINILVASIITFKIEVPFCKSFKEKLRLLAPAKASV